MKAVSHVIPLLFFWMTADGVAGNGQPPCTGKNQGSCEKNEICATINKFGINGKRCVEAKRCVGQSEGKCPALTECEALHVDSFACVLIPCSTKSYGACPSGQVCTPHKQRDGAITHECEKGTKDECGVHSKGICPRGYHCKQQPPSYSCEIKESPCDICKTYHVCRPGAPPDAPPDAPPFSCKTVRCDNNKKCKEDEVCKDEPPFKFCTTD